MSRTVARLAWVALVANLFVIVWGGWVRASGSGAGCGSHWPTCNGTIIPQSPTLHTIIEFTHRASTGLAFLLVLAMAIAAFRALPPGHRARRWAAVTVALFFVEAGIGAGLVKLKLVADNATLGRGISLGIHLVNTQFLLSAILLTAWWAARNRDSMSGIGPFRRAFAVAFAGLIAVGMAGAMASLGDTLFPARSLAEGLAQDRNPALNVLLQVRVWHPVLAIVTGFGVMLLASRVAQGHEGNQIRLAARRVHVAVALQWTLGALSLVLLVPVALQLLHLLVADLVWLSVVWLAATASAHQVARTNPATTLPISASNSVPAPSSM